jgi:DNA polymerase IV
MAAVPEQGFRRVLHCDLDCFFAAVEELDDPSLRGKPVIVGGSPDRRGVVATANYIARRYGVHSAMSAALARRLCPEAVFLRGRYERYRELSQRVMAILDEYFEVFEQVSIDEAYGELAPGLPGCTPAETVAREIKARVHDEVGLIISVGAGRTKSIAKLASDLSKPDGCLVVKPGAERAFLRPLPVGKLHGVGPRTAARLEKTGMRLVGDVADGDPDELAQHFGRHGRWLWQLANGEDDRPVVSDHGPPKSISRETTFERDVAGHEQAETLVRELAESVAQRAERHRLQGRTVTLKVKWSDFRLMTRQRPLAAPSYNAAPIAGAAVELLAAEVAPLLERAGLAIRLLGVGLSGFEAPSRGLAGWQDYVQMPLFAEAK